MMRVTAATAAAGVSGKFADFGIAGGNGTACGTSRRVGSAAL